MSTLIFVTPKRHILAWFPVIWVITRQNRSKGLTCGLFTEKKVYICTYVPVRKNNLTLYFTHLPRSPPWKDLHQNWYSGSSRGYNQLWQFFWQSVKGFGFCRGPKFAISHWLSRSPLTQCWRYRAARDSSYRLIIFDDCRIVRTNGNCEVSHELQDSDITSYYSQWLSLVPLNA